MLDNKKIFVCIAVWFNPSKEIITKWRRVIDEYKEKGLFIIVDNTPDESVRERFEYALSDNGICIQVNQNLGIAEAQNIGIRRALETESNHIFFFDQDSEIPPLYFENMIEAYARIESKIQKPFILGPKHISINQNIDYKVQAQEKIDEYSIVESILSSGSLVNREVIDSVGLMMESLFIDQVDHEYCYRAGSKGIPTIVNNKVVLHHQIGQKIISILGINFIISSPFRYYYQFRNAIILLKLNYVRKGIKRKLILRKSIDFFMQPLLNYQNGLSVLGFIVKGIKDGLKYKV